MNALEACAAYDPERDRELLAELRKAHAEFCASNARLLQRAAVPWWWQRPGLRDLPPLRIEEAMAADAGELLAAGVRPGRAARELARLWPAWGSRLAAELVRAVLETASGARNAA